MRNYQRWEYPLGTEAGTKNAFALIALHIERISMTAASASKSNQSESSTTASTATLPESLAKALAGRGIDPRFAEKLGVRSSRNAGRGNWIEIPVFKDGVEVNVKYRTIIGDKEFSQKEGGEKCFYNYDVIQKWDKQTPLLITEGELDCITAMQCGYNAVSVPDGAPAQILNGETRKYEYLEGFPDKGTVIICADSDATGQNLLHDLALRLGRGRCKWVKYPKGCKDLNDALRLYGKKGVDSAIATAKWIEIDGLSLLSEMPPLEKPEHRECSFIPYNVRKGDFWVITGIPSMGKTQMANHLAYDMARQGWHVTFASFEQKPQTQHKYNLRTLFMDKPAATADLRELEQADEWIDDHYSFITPPRNRQDKHDLAWLLDMMGNAVRRYGADMFVIDPWNEIQHEFDGRGTSATEYIRFAIMELKHFAEDYRVVVMIVAHPSKPMKTKASEGILVPTLYDIEDSRHWYNKAEVGLIVHLNQDGTTLARVAKSRYHEDIGKPHDHILDFDTKTKRFRRSGNPYA